MSAVEQTKSLTGVWIPVTEQLPALFHRVLVYDPSIPKFVTHEGIRSHNFIAIGYFRGFDDPFSSWSVPDGGKPTHWMPLPDDPNVVILEDERGRFISSQDH